MRQRIFACRDRFGVKPFFYTQKNDVTVFASELKSLFEYPDVSAVLDKTGLCELFALSPARTQGVGVFKDVRELRPARYMIINRHGMTIKKYWSLVSGEHKDSYEETIEKVRSLVYDSVKRQLISDVPIATFLSGGLDSSIINAIGAMEMKKKKAKEFQSIRLIMRIIISISKRRIFSRTVIRNGCREWWRHLIQTIHILFARITCLRSFWRRHFWRRICRVWQT